MRSFRKAVLLIGMPVSSMLMLGGAAIATVREVSAAMYAAMGAFSLMAGGFFAALYHCRVQRRKGLLHGLLCGLAITVFWCFVAWMVNGQAGFGFPMLWGMLGGIGGGIWGVNLQAPLAKRQTHSIQHLRQKVFAVSDACRKRRFRKPWQEDSAPDL